MPIAQIRLVITEMSQFLHMIEKFLTVADEATSEKLYYNLWLLNLETSMNSNHSLRRTMTIITTTMMTKMTVLSPS